MRPDHQPLPPPWEPPVEPPDARGLFEVFSMADESELRLPRGGIDLGSGVGFLMAEFFGTFAVVVLLAAVAENRQGGSDGRFLGWLGFGILSFAALLALLDFFGDGPDEVVFDRRTGAVRWLGFERGPGFSFRPVRQEQRWKAARARYECYRPNKGAERHRLILEWGAVEDPVKLLAIDCLRQPSRPEEAWAAIRSYMADGAVVTKPWRLQLPVQAPLRQAVWQQLQAFLPTDYGRDYRAAAIYSARQPGSVTLTLAVILFFVIVATAFVARGEAMKAGRLAINAGWAGHLAYLLAVVTIALIVLAAFWSLCMLLLKINAHALRRWRRRLRPPPLQP